MFVWSCAHNQPYRQIEDRFEKSLGLIGAIIIHVADVMRTFVDTILVPKGDLYTTVHEKFMPYAPFFDGCIGALDGRHIPVTVEKRVKLDYMNRNGITTINVCAIVDMDLRFTFVSAGMVGSVHDMEVLNDCRQNAPTFPHPPAGVYCISFNLYHSFELIVH